jgi:hypothetical protein
MTLDELAETFETIALRYRHVASAFRITGRLSLAEAAGARAEAFTEAAQIAREGRDMDLSTFNRMYPRDES